MASLFKNPLEAIVGETNKPDMGPLAMVQQAAEFNSEYPAAAGWEFIGTDIDSSRWNKSYPYQVLMVEKSGGGYVTKGTFTLPIPPQDMQISTPFAISTNVTLGGIVEEHNGAPLRNISFSGTTGVVPLKGSGEGLQQGNLLTGIFAGTVNAFERLKDNVATLTGENKANTALVDESADDILRGTGYYQFRLFQQFLEYYANTKKTAAGHNLRLALAIWKDQAVYLVTPMAFDVRRSASSPWEYTYSLQFKGWKRITLGPGPDSFAPFGAITRDPNAFAQCLNALQDARKVLQSSRDVLLAVSSDVERTILEPLRSVVLFAKDLLGVTLTAFDLPASIKSSFKSAVLESQRSFDDLAQESYGSSDLAVTSSKAETRAGRLNNKASALNASADEFNRVFDNPDDYPELMETIKPSELNLAPEVQKRITEEKRRVRTLKRLDFETLRNEFVEFQAQFADSVGAGDATYNATYGRPTVVATKTPTESDFEVMFNLNRTILELNRLAASTVIDNRVPTVEAVAGMARAAGIAFTVPTSKFAVPFPYGQTLEQLAAQYLGDPNRWHEIVALNGLRQPYVDEEGFDLDLLTNGNGNQVIVADASNLYQGQLVWLSSTGTNRTMRRITKVDRVSAGQTILTLDGESDLEAFDVTDDAVLHAFLPDTVNSQQLIYIPSDLETEDDFSTKAIPGVDQFDPLIRAGGVDLLLNQKGDLVITPDGDCRLAVGLTNLIQRIRTAIGTRKGSLIHHPEYGLGIVPGMSTADLDPRSMLAALQDMFRSDPAFSGVSGVAIQKLGPVVRVAMSVGIAGTTQTIPLTVNINR